MDRRRNVHRQRVPVRRALEHAGQCVGQILALERTPPRRHLMQQATESPDVTTLVRLTLSPALATCSKRCQAVCPAVIMAGDVIVGDADTSGNCRTLRLPLSGTARAFSGPGELGQAESSTFTVPSGRSLMLAGLRSRWMIPCSWAASSASAISVAMGSASPST